MKKLIVKMALAYAKSAITPSVVTDWLVSGLTEVAARAHANPSSQAVVERVEKVCSSLKDGIVTVEEVNLICGDIVTQENINSVIDIVGKKVTK